jgi:phosphoribosylamine--glycine ligase
VEVDGNTPLHGKIKQSPLCDKLFIAPGNAGTAGLGENIDLSPNDFEGLKALVLAQQIEMVVVGPEEPLVRGVYDFLETMLH